MNPASCPLSPRDQLEHYRDLTAEAVERAQATTDPKLKATLVDSALRWLTQAQEAEQAVARSAVSTGSVEPAFLAEEDAEQDAQ